MPRKKFCQKWDSNPRPHTWTRSLCTCWLYMQARPVSLESGALDHSAILTVDVLIGQHPLYMLRTSKGVKKIIWKYAAGAQKPVPYPLWHAINWFKWQLVCRHKQYIYSGLNIKLPLDWKIVSLIAMIWCSMACVPLWKNMQLVSKLQLLIILIKTKKQNKGAPRVELGTSRSAVECSTTELHPHSR